MHRKSWLVMVIAVIVAMGLVACAVEDGEQGPQGPEGPAGPPGAGYAEYTFLGNGGEDCMHCHAGTVESWENTLHPDAYADLTAEDKENPYCLKCHVTGWDSPVSYGDTTITNYGPDTTGFDDYFQVEGDTAAMRRAALAGVQCEACHGAMGPDFNAHKPAMSFATRRAGNVATGDPQSLCEPCHSTQIEEWGGYGEMAASGHSHPTGTLEDFNNEHYAHIGSCASCHTTEGFVEANDATYADYEFDHTVHPIGCVACHDPHANPDGNHQLRSVDPVEFAFDPSAAPEDPHATVSGYGNGQLCMQCHHGRRDNDHVNDQIANGYAHFGPHSSPQMDMFGGSGSYQVAATYDTSHFHQTLTDACVTCHMTRETFLHGETVDHAFHTFSPGLENCQTAGCHGNATTIEDIVTSGHDVTTIMDYADSLAAGLGFADAAAFESGASDWSQLAGTTSVQREAGYALIFVLSDGSRGVHNPDYAFSLLDNAITYLHNQGEWQ